MDRYIPDIDKGVLMGEGGTAVHQENYGCSQIQNKITLIVEASEIDETLINKEE